jgi:O-antigen/teichoic acid export membrane protein
MAYKILFILGMVISLSCIFYADDLYFLLYAKQYQDSSILLSILMVSFVPVSLAHCFGSFLIADGQLKAINIIFLIGLIINIIGNYVLIPQMESIGAAYTTVATQLFLLIGMAVYLSIKQKGIKLNKLFFQTVVICSLFGLIFFIIEKLVLFWMLKLVISILITGAIAILIKWIDLSLAFQLIKRKK